jgi:hypothetical protein
MHSRSEDLENHAKPTTPLLRYRQNIPQLDPRAISTTPPQRKPPFHLLSDQHQYQYFLNLPPEDVSIGDGAGWGDDGTVTFAKEHILF